MSAVRRLCFNLADIFNDHRKLCYLSVNCANFNTVKDFKLHVQSGFKINEHIYFCDEDGVLFPDFDFITTLLEHSGVIWVRKIRDGGQEDERKPVNCIKDITTTTPAPGNDSASNSLIEKNSKKHKKDRKLKKKFKKNDEETLLENNFIQISDENDESSIIDPRDFVKTAENIPHKSYVSDASIEIQSNTNVNGCDKSTENLSCTIYDKSCRKSPLSSGEKRHHLGDGDCNYDGNSKTTNNFVQSPVSLSCLQLTSPSLVSSDYRCRPESEEVQNVSVSEKRKRKRKRTRQKKKTEENCISELQSDYKQTIFSDPRSKVNIHEEVCSTTNKHIKFESDDDIDSDTNFMIIGKGNGDSSEKNCKADELNDKIESDLNSRSELKCTENNFSISTVKISEETANRKIYSNGLDSNGEFKYDIKQNFYSKPVNENLYKIKQTNWDKKDDCSGMFYDELLKLKHQVKGTSHFKSPVFNRTPKPCSRNKNVLHKDVENNSNDKKCDNSANESSINNAIERTNSLQDVTLKVDDIVNFKILFLSQDYTPTVSDNIIGRVVSVSSEVIQFKILLGQDICKPLTGKFALMSGSENGENNDIVELHLKDLISPKKIINPFSMLCNSNN